MSDASVNLAGGVVSCDFGSTADQRRHGPPAAARAGAVGHDQVAHLERRQDGLLRLELALRVVAALDVGAAVAGELDRLAVQVERAVLAAGPCAVNSTVVLRTRASGICDAIVRFQMRS